MYFADLFPTRSVITVETLGFLALVLHMFLVGLELDLTAIGRISKKAVVLTITGLFLPLIAGIVFFYLLRELLDHKAHKYYHQECGFLWAASLEVTSFPAVSQILSDLKLLNSENGRLALPIALISDLVSWILVVILIPFCSNPLHAHNKNFSDSYLRFALVSVVLSASVTDVTGTHPIVGAFIFGLIMPDDLAIVLKDRFAYFISELLMLVFFVIAGLRVDIFKITKWSLVFFVVILLFSVKVINFLPVSAVSNINTKDSFALGLLMSTKGIWAVLIVLTGLDHKVLRDGDYAVTIIAILFMNSIIASTIAAIYKMTKIFVKRSSRSIKEAKSEAELRILVCIHSYCNVPGILKLLGATHDSRRNHMTVFTLHLIELPGRPAAMIIMHDSHTPRATKEGTLRETITSFRNINQNVLLNAPCSVGIFIDRGLEEAKVLDPDEGIHDIAVLFLGGVDDCEALAYTWRMSRKPGVSLTVIRLLEIDLGDSLKENDIDDDYINTFRTQTANQEKTLHDGKELTVTLKEMENKFELFIVGRREGLKSSIRTELHDMIECPELGVIGDLLALSDSATSSVLVVKQFIEAIDSQVIEDLVRWSLTER
ncbi:cation/H(+) antiporter 15-like [Hibiscus syriacus]|uniref:cation/H(+) antiporter 15-like n=1 Tax=Hibiscus syriacus TaxID=106335 RepID=UPI00192161AE|nr:cation/H(+) antiporter 15-like [Hibiscus syriacus]